MVGGQMALAGQPAAGAAQLGRLQPGPVAAPQSSARGPGLGRASFFRATDLDRLPLLRRPFSSPAAFSNAASNSGSTAISAAWWAPAAVESTLTKSKSACPRAAASATAGVHQVLEDALGRPRPEPVVDGGPRTVLVGHVPPWAARAEPPHHRVELPPQIRDRAPLAHRQMGLDQGPLVVCEVTTRHARCPTRAARHRADESTTS